MGESRELRASVVAAYSCRRRPPPPRCCLLRFLCCRGCSSCSASLSSSLSSAPAAPSSSLPSAAALLRRRCLSFFRRCLPSSAASGAGTAGSIEASVGQKAMPAGGEGGGAKAVGAAAQTGVRSAPALAADPWAQSFARTRGQRLNVDFGEQLPAAHAVQAQVAIQPHRGKHLAARVHRQRARRAWETRPGAVGSCWRCVGAGPRGKAAGTARARPTHS